MKEIKLIIIVLLSSISTFAQSTDPYAIFGHSTNVIYETNVTEMLYIKNTDSTSIYKALAFDMENNKVKLLGAGDTIIQLLPIKANQLLRWLSTDPKNQFVISPYQSFLNNPIKHTDPDGGWIPGVDKNGNITITAEKGDNRNTLFAFFNSNSQATKFLPTYAQNKLAVFNANDVIQLNESNFSLAIKDAKNNPEKYRGAAYNCTDAAYSGSKGYDIINSSETTGGHIFPNADNTITVHFQEQLDVEFKQITNPNQLIFGQSVGTFREEQGGDIDHAAVFFGRSRNGTPYVFTKNGFINSQPQVMPLSQMQSVYPNLKIAGNKEGDPGLYNPLKAQPAIPQTSPTPAVNH